MSLRRWKAKLVKATDVVSGAVDTVKEKAAEALDTTLTLGKAEEVLAEDLEKGIRIFDEMGLPEEIGDSFQEEIAEFAMKKLQEAWAHPDRKDV